MEKVKDLNYWKNNCEEDYLHTPISVLRYITELEKEVESKINFIDSSLQFKEKYKPIIEELEKDLKEWDKLNDEGKLNNEKWLRHHAFVKGQLSALYNL